jgi:hypothetical protein
VTRRALEGLAADTAAAFPGAGAGGALALNLALLAADPRSAEIALEVLRGVRELRRHRPTTGEWRVLDRAWRAARAVVSR